jgi:hypothetical protein
MLERRHVGHRRTAKPLDAVFVIAGRRHARIDPDPVREFVLPADRHRQANRIGTARS